MYLLEEGKQKRSYIWVWPIIIVCLLIAAVPLYFGTRKSSDSDSTIEQKQTKSVILPIQAPSANNTPPIPYQEGNPHPVPEAPLSLMGARLTSAVIALPETFRMEERRRRGGFYTRDVEIYIILGVDSRIGPIRRLCLQETEQGQGDDHSPEV